MFSISPSWRGARADIGVDRNGLRRAASARGRAGGGLVDTLLFRARVAPRRADACRGGRIAGGACGGAGRYVLRDAIVATDADRAVRRVDHQIMRVIDELLLQDLLENGIDRLLRARPKHGREGRASEPPALSDCGSLPGTAEAGFARSSSSTAPPPGRLSSRSCWSCCARARTWSKTCPCALFALKTSGDKATPPDLAPMHSMRRQRNLQDRQSNPGWRDDPWRSPSKRRCRHGRD